ncbi:Magnesium transporter mgtE [Bhargavaea cecembensis DSE10]|uniref:Magnesium transporter MgtE n=1 Tax=Bhargavaea cecembensis DSE10 TaxID=1235279 RepID=M7N9N6_9BACL|nr:magnesium transporter [Bhargavaea cecembensis]EMR05273.1 Magnesium transporter mgtE [Bhargavaea cecembensis DSE10]
MAADIQSEQLTIALVRQLKEGDRKGFLKLFLDLRPYDQAVQYMEIPKKHHPLILEWLDLPAITEMLPYLEPEDQMEFIRSLGPDKAIPVLDMMQNDDLAAMLTDLSPEEIDQLTGQMLKEEAESVRKILDYPAETAGRIMTNRFVWVHEDYTVGQTVEKLKNYSDYAEYLNYTYVINSDKQLIGVLSYRQLLLTDADTPVRDIMSRRVISANARTDQEDVAKQFARYDFVAVPVTDDDNVLVGIITVDDVIDVIVQEADEDIEMLMASGKQIDFRTKPVTAAMRRLPWLILLLFIGLVSGSIISGFEDTLNQVVALAFFMPLIAGMTGNTGTQSLSLIVRGLATEDLDMKTAIRVVLRELMVGILIGVICGVLISIIAFVWQGSFILGIVVGASLVITLIIGTLAGTIIPLVLSRFKFDPAVASGPLITTVNDILSLLIYFGIATMFLNYLT